MTQRHGPRVTASVTQITDVTPGASQGLTPKCDAAPQLQTGSLQWRRPVGHPSLHSGCPSGVTPVLDTQSSGDMALHHFCPKTTEGFALGTTERGKRSGGCTQDPRVEHPPKASPTLSPAVPKPGGSTRGHPPPRPADRTAA